MTNYNYKPRTDEWRPKLTPAERVRAAKLVAIGITIGAVLVAIIAFSSMGTNRPPARILREVKARNTEMANYCAGQGLAGEAHAEIDAAGEWEVIGSCVKRLDITTGSR